MSKIFNTAVAIIFAVTTIGCSNESDDPLLDVPIYSVPPEQFYMFEGCEGSFGVKEVTLDAAGGEVVVNTRVTWGGRNVELHDIITGASIVLEEYDPWGSYELKAEADFSLSRCGAGYFTPSPNGFEWCNPQGCALWVHQWLAVSQDDANVYLYLQPNEGTDPRTAFVTPQAYPLHGFIKVTQAATPAL